MNVPRGRARFFGLCRRVVTAHRVKMARAGNIGTRPRLSPGAVVTRALALASVCVFFSRRFACASLYKCRAVPVSTPGVDFPRAR